jgi:hypothetical protein
VQWKRSTRCDTANSCVEVQDLAGTAILVRNSAKHHVVVAMLPADWREFLGRIKNGEFDGTGMA